MPAVEAASPLTPGTVRCNGVFLEEGDIDELDTLRTAMASVSALIAGADADIPGVDVAAILSVFADCLSDIVAVEKPAIAFDMPTFLPH